LEKPVRRSEQKEMLLVAGTLAAALAGIRAAPDGDGMSHARANGGPWLCC
jgi:hypothetical protein